MAYYCKGKRQICENPTKCSGCRYFDSTGGYIATNADRIRAMSDEELAEYIAGIIDDANSGSVIYSNRTEEWLEWLKQPAK